MKRIIIFILSIFLVPSVAYSREYGHYDLNKMRTISETPAGKKYDIDKSALDPMLQDLGFHARNTPAQFDSPQDQERAILDVKVMSGMLDILINEPKPNEEILLRAGFLNLIGRNLGVQDSAKKADAIFKKLLKIAPSDPQGNYLYGIFLASESKTKKAIPYLKKALAVGVTEASYTLGMAYLKLGNKQKALDNLETFKQSSPYIDETVMTLISELRGSIPKPKTSKKNSK